MEGKWNELIKAGNDAVDQDFNYKRLRQRMGYAYFMKEDYYSSMAQYEAALAFDKSDLDTRAYLYYCGLYSGNESYANYHAAKLPVEIQKKLGVKPFKIVDAVDVEYNYKSNDSKAITKDSLTRSSPTYWRIGVNTKLSNQLSLYQAFSGYKQKIDSVDSKTFVNISRYTYINQNEYYAGLTWKPLMHFDFMLAYHWIGTTINDSVKWQIQPDLQKFYHRDTTISLTGHMFYGKIGFKYNRVDLGLSASLLAYNKLLTQQYTLQAGVTLPGSLGIQLRSKVDALFDNEDRRLIFTQTVGFAPLKRVWIEGGLTLGNLKNYADYNALYILNSKDPTVFKVGATAFWQLINNVTLFGNYNYETKQMKVSEETLNTITNYNQHSFSGGIIWKI